MTLVDIKQTINLEHSLIQLRSDGILQVEFAENTVLDVEECDELITNYSSILGDEKVPILHIFGKFTEATKGAREFSASPRGLKHSLVEAYVLSSLPHRILLNFYIKFNKPAVPTKYFGTKQEAVAWLKKFL